MNYVLRLLSRLPSSLSEAVSWLLVNELPTCKKDLLLQKSLMLGYIPWRLRISSDTMQRKSVWVCAFCSEPAKFM